MMNKTKKLTQGAMMLAIIGALIVIDRMTAYWFSELLVLMMPTVIVMYSSMYSLNDGFILSVGLLIISFLLGNFNYIYLVYVPVGIVTGLAYSYGVKRNLDKTSLMFIAMAVYVIGEIIATFVISPLMGMPITTLIEEVKLSLNETGKLVGINYTDLLTSMGLDISKLLIVIFIFTVILMGILEGLLIHLLNVFLLKRFKIKDLGSINIYDIKPNPVVAYISFLSIFAVLYIRDIKNETLYYVLVVIAILGAIVLLYYGYLFMILFGVIVLKRNIGGLFVIIAFFFPVLLFALLIIGFLYGSGPLRRYIESKAQA